MNVSYTVRLFFVFLLTIFSFGCGQEKQITDDIKNRFGLILVDPESLQLRGISFYRDGTACGEFNSKNKMGGYVGFKKFIFSKHGLLEKLKGDNNFRNEFPTTELLVDEDGNSIDADIGKLWCSDSLDYETKMYRQKLQIIDLNLSMLPESEIEARLLYCDAKKKELEKIESDSAKPNSFDYILIPSARLLKLAVCDKFESGKKDRALLLKLKGDLKVSKNG